MMATNGSNGAAPGVNGGSAALNGKAYPIEDHTFDVVVVGAGGAGLRAAIEASATGVKVGWSASHC